MVINCVSLLFFKQTTAYDLRISDWSSDVCSSDLFGSVALASSHTETGKKVRELGLGYTFEPPEVESLVAFLRGYSMAEHLARREIGRASCRERVCPNVLISVAAVILKKKTPDRTTQKTKNPKKNKKHIR